MCGRCKIHYPARATAVFICVNYYLLTFHFCRILDADTYDFDTKPKKTTETEPSNFKKKIFLKGDDTVAV